jgi:hypothetical protein
LLINLNLRASLTVGLENGDTEMTELIQLTDAELDVVCGGIFDFGNAVSQTQNATNLNLNVLSVQAGSTTQAIGQFNTSLIGSAIVL